MLPLGVPLSSLYPAPGLGFTSKRRQVQRINIQQCNTDRATCSPAVCLFVFSSSVRFQCWGDPLLGVSAFQTLLQRQSGGWRLSRLLPSSVRIWRSGGQPIRCFWPTARALFPQSPWFPRAQDTSATRTSIRVAVTCCCPYMFRKSKWWQMFYLLLAIKRPRSIMFYDFPLLPLSVNKCFENVLFCDTENISRGFSPIWLLKCTLLFFGIEECTLSEKM